jgi:hypothetical protein
MEPTTITTICLILFGVGITSWAIYLWFSDWQPEVKRYLGPEERLEAEIQAAVDEMPRCCSSSDLGFPPYRHFGISPHNSEAA